MAEFFSTLAWIWVITILGGGVLLFFVLMATSGSFFEWELKETIVLIVGIIIIVVGSLVWQNWYKGTISYERAVIEFNSKVSGIERVVEVYDRDCNILKETHIGDIYVNYEGNYVEVHLKDSRILYNNNCVITKEKE